MLRILRRCFSHRAPARRLGVSLIMLGGWAGAATAAAPSEDEPLSSVERGRQLFVRLWTVKDEQTPGGDGLGPMFNGRSCVECHNQGGVGGSGSLMRNVDLFTVIPPKTKDVDRKKFAAGIAKLHPGLSINPTSVRPNVTLHRSSTTPSYGNFRVSLSMVADALPVETVPDRVAVQITQRRTPALFGAGLIDSIPDKVIQAMALYQANTKSKVKGVAARASDGGVGKFGWRGQTSTLEAFVRGACANELGLSSPRDPQPIDPLVQNPKSAGIDLTHQQCDDLTTFVASLPAPQPAIPGTYKAKKQWMEGARVFDAVGCAECHVARLGNVEGIYSDLLLHDMGLDLADPVPANALSSGASRSATYYGGPTDIFADIPAETKRRWRTPSLWAVASSEPYLHDGRAPTIDGAILLHGGEATTARKNYTNLAGEHREALLAFLQSLGAPNQTATLAAAEQRQ